MHMHTNNTLITGVSIQTHIFSATFYRYRDYWSKERERDKLTQINIQGLSSSTLRAFTCLHKQFKQVTVLQVWSLQPTKINQKTEGEWLTSNTSKINLKKSNSWQTFKKTSEMQFVRRLCDLKTLKDTCNSLLTKILSIFFTLLCESIMCPCHFVLHHHH